MSKENKKRHFSNWLRAYMGLTEDSEAPLPFHFWTAVATVAGALRRRVWREEIIFQWTPNFYIILVGPPGIATKSTSMRIGLSLLRDIPGVHFGPTSVTWQGLTESFKMAQEMVSYPNDKGTNVADSPLGDVILKPMSCLTCDISELGTFLRPDDQDLVNLLTDIWDGQIGSWRRGTKGIEGRAVIENPWLNIIGCTTPAWLSKNITDDMIGGGLISRIIFVYGDKKRQVIAYPSDLIDVNEHDELKEKLVEDLLQISSMAGAYEITPEAKAWGKEWYEEHWGSKPLHLAGNRYGGYYSRKQAHIHKLAMVFAAAQRNELVIELEDVQFAHRTITALEEDMNKVFKSIGLSDTAKNVREILIYLTAYKKMSKKELVKLCFSIMSNRDFKDAIDTAISAGYMRTAPEGGEQMYYIDKKVKFE